MLSDNFWAYVFHSKIYHLTGSIYIYLYIIWSPGFIWPWNYFYKWLWLFFVTSPLNMSGFRPIRFVSPSGRKPDLQWQIEKRDERHVWSSGCELENRTPKRSNPGSGIPFELGIKDVRERGDSTGFPGHRCGRLGSGRSRIRRNRELRHRCRICTYRRKEGAAPLLPASKEAGKTRSLFVLQSMLRLLNLGI